MAEPAQPSGPHDAAAPRVPTDAGSTAAYTPPPIDLAAPPTDDKATVISTRPPQPISNDEALAAVLRGRMLAHYELLEAVGVGGMAAVLRARDTQLDRTVALKILPPDMAVDAENVRRFHQEARAAARLDHEHIARAFFCGEDQGLHFIAFEFVEGENLRTVLDRRGRLPADEAVHYLLQIATGLAHAAERGVVHRDIKPSNIIITPGGRAKLVDMGLARSQHADHGLTQSGVTLGTFDYISPEQALEPRDADARSDIYSLGCTGYHMLTGQPPVPEGTAAKKLHHHQHVAPADPRQLNAAIPDAVALLLGRMMAKDPRERFQHPDDLVQQLHALSQQLGPPSFTGARSAAERVTFIAPPPQEPSRGRPVLVTLAALAALVVFVFVLSPRPQPVVERKPRTEPRDVGHAEKNAAPNLAEAQPVLPMPRTPVRPAQRVRTVQELQDALDKADTRVTLEENLELTGDDLLRFQGESLVLQGAGAARPTIRLRYDGSPLDGPWAVLTIRRGKVTLRNLRFEIDAAASPDVVLTAVELLGGQLTVEDCEFVQGRPGSAGPGYLSSVLVAPDGIGKPVLTLSECLFAGGQRGVSLSGPARVEVKQTAFGPHTSTFYVQDTARADDADVQLTHCSLLLTDGAVLRLADGGAGRLDAENSLFAAATPGRAALIRQSGTGTVRYRGRQNGFYNLAAYLLPAAPENAITKLAEFRRTGETDDKTSVELTTSPWADSDPVAALQRDDAQQAFMLNVTLPALRLAEDRSQLVGVQRGPWGASYDRVPPLPADGKPPEAVVRKEKEKVVDPTVTTSHDGVYPTVGQALGEANPGDVILIKHSGPLKVDAVRLEKPSIDLTIKPYPKYHPILHLGDASDPDAALFRLHDGRVLFEGLEFHLQPRLDKYKTQTIVALVGDGQCTFKDCVATLEETKEVQLSLAAVADPTNVMRMVPTVPRQTGPTLKLEGCFVRGGGDLVVVRPSRPFDLRVERSLLVLDGSLLVVDGSAREASAGSGQVSLSHVTTYLTDHLIWLRANKEEGRASRGLALTQVTTAESCLFAAAAGKALIHLDGVDTDEQMKRLFGWGEGRGNVYSHFPALLDQQPRDTEGAMMLPPYDSARWEHFTRDLDSHYDPVKFVQKPAEGQSAHAQPADFRVKDGANLQGYGADVDKLPKPAEGPPEETPAD